MSDILTQHVEFGTDGIRGEAGKAPFTPLGMRAVGRAIGTCMAQPGDTIVIGHDGRYSGEGLVAALSLGMNEVGVNVKDIGLMPSPGVVHATQFSEAVAGVSVSASHNPWGDNGVKPLPKMYGWRDSSKLTDEAQKAITLACENGVQDRGPRGLTYRDARASGQYARFLVDSAEGDRFDGMSIVLDTANGAASGTAGKVFAALGAHVDNIHDKPTGYNINENCGATSLESLMERVVTTGADLGLAFDGDADRVKAVYPSKRSGQMEALEFDGDKIIALLALAGGYKGVALTEMSNEGVVTALRERGVKVSRTDVGDRAVLESMIENDYRIGGEQAGHIVVREKLFTGDGMLAAIQLVRALRASGKTLEQWSDELPLFPQSQIKIPLPVADRRFMQHPAVADFKATKNDALSGNGRVFIRPSGTEPIARVLVEMREGDAAAFATQTSQELQQLLGKVKIEAAIEAITPRDPAEIRAAGEGLEALGYRIVTGRNADLEKQLIEKSKQPAIRHECYRDPEDRFKDAASFETWAQKGREIHWLVNDQGDLAGIIWYGEEAYPKQTKAPEVMTPEDLTATYAVRLYEGHAGTKGLFTAYNAASLALYANNKLAAGEAVPTLHLQTNSDNTRAWGAYTMLGYKLGDIQPYTPPNRPDDHINRVTMGLPSEHILAIAGRS